MRKFKKAFAVIGMIAVLLCMGLLTGCESLRISGELVLNEDGSGTRSITATLTKGDAGDGYGDAYYYLKKHGNELQSYIADVYAEKVPGSGDWLVVTVNDGATTETMTLSFEFTSFADYTEKLGKLAKFGNATAEYTAPTLTSNLNGSVTYTEETSVQKAIYLALQKHIMDDETVFDIDCTIDGNPANLKQDEPESGGYYMASDYEGLLKYGFKYDQAELFLPPPSISVKVGATNARDVSAADGKFTTTAHWNGAPVSTKEAELVLDYSFNDTLENAGKMGAEGNLSLGTGSAQTAPTFVEGIDGKGYYFDGKSYLTTANKTFAYDELTVSFYYKMEEYVTTDTGANQLIVPAGLGALGAGCIDLEFINDPDTEVDGAQFLVKMNSSNWAVQDKLYSETAVKLNEWHCYTVVFANEYDADGVIQTAYVYLYVDGELADRNVIANGVGLRYTLGMEDETETACGGVNIGGWYFAGELNRTCKGTLDNLKIYDGALSAAQVKSQCYTVSVEDANKGTEQPAKKKTKGCGSAVVSSASVAAGVVLLAIAFCAIVINTKNKKNENA